VQYALEQGGQLIRKTREREREREINGGKFFVWVSQPLKKRKHRLRFKKGKKGKKEIIK
jgi:hypothetical protein